MLTNHSQQHPRRRLAPPAIAYISVLVAGLLTAAGIKTLHDFAVESVQRELLRVTSPDRRVDAVFVRSKFRALGADFALYIVPQGEPVPAWGPVIRGADFAQPPVLRWPKNQLLEIQFGRGCVEDFYNLWNSYDVAGGSYFVETRLDPVTDYPCLGELPHHPSASPSHAGGSNGPAR